MYGFTLHGSAGSFCSRFAYVASYVCVHIGYWLNSIRMIDPGDLLQVPLTGRDAVPLIFLCIICTIMTLLHCWIMALFLVLQHYMLCALFHGSNAGCKVCSCHGPDCIMHYKIAGPMVLQWFMVFFSCLNSDLPHV